MDKYAEKTTNEHSMYLIVLYLAHSDENVSNYQESSGGVDDAWY